MPQVASEVWMWQDWTPEKNLHIFHPFTSNGCICITLKSQRGGERQQTLLPGLSFLKKSFFSFWKLLFTVSNYNHALSNDNSLGMQLLPILPTIKTYTEKCQLQALFESLPDHNSSHFSLDSKVNPKSTISNGVISSMPYVLVIRLSVTLVIQLFNMIFQHSPLLSNAVGKLLSHSFTRQLPHILFI